MSQKPAEIGRVETHGNEIAVGKPANIVLFDPETKVVVDRDDTASKSNNNPFHAMELLGRTALTMLRGKTTYKAEWI
jgi:dihydroorotase